MKQKTMHIGLDDTDSTRKGCTTYIAALLVEKLPKAGATFIDYPSLVRLNPNVPWKTRGNGSLCLRINYDAECDDSIKETVISEVENGSDLAQRGTDPGIVFLNAAKIPRKIRVFARNTITRISKLKDALKLVGEYKGEALAFKGGRGVIGALAAIGETFQSDFTYEAIAYRMPENCGKKRKVDEKSIYQMDEATASFTFNNVDAEKKRVIITPRGPDPILFGIRGENPEAVKKAFRMVKTLEPIERWVIFRTNQGTDAHLEHVNRLSQIKPYSSVIVRGTVFSNPEMIRGRHVIFPIIDDASRVDCAAFEPTGNLRAVARKLIAGDRLIVCGGVRPPSNGKPLTINLEKFRLTKLAPKVLYDNPVCLKCGTHLKSMGQNQGFRCDRCRRRYPSLEKVAVKLDRDVTKDLYITSTRSQRHLTKPSERYGREKRRSQAERLIDEWHFP
jgi:tRNA(Ile2)-agmatinylcytidine synthase